MKQKITGLSLLLLLVAIIISVTTYRYNKQSITYINKIQEISVQMDALPKIITMEQALKDGDVVIGGSGRLHKGENALKAYLHDTQQGLQSQIRIYEFSEKGYCMVVYLFFDGKMHYGVNDFTRQYMGDDEVKKRGLFFTSIALLERNGKYSLVLSDNKNLTVDSYLEAAKSADLKKLFSVQAVATFEKTSDARTKAAPDGAAFCFAIWQKYYVGEQQAVYGTGLDLYIQGRHRLRPSRMGETLPLAGSICLRSCILGTIYAQSPSGLGWPKGLF
ncbi:hypothetical protein LI291_05390 [Intestinibacillus massiliensis]|nr:hypothetical protein [Intestinibacillus massiliensis]